MISSILKRCDFIGVSPKIYYKGHFRYRTESGGLLSIIITCLLIFLSTYFLYIFISRKSFTIYENTITKEKAKKIWKKEDFSIIILDKYFSKIENSSQIFSIYADIWTDKRYSENGTLKSKTEIYPVQLEKCNISSFKNFNLWKDEKLINDSVCFSQEAIDNNINSTGTYGETGYTGIVFWISLCMNNSNKNDCLPYEESKKILDNVFVYVKILDYYFDHNVITNNIIPYIRSDLIQASASIYKRQWYLFQEVEYITDVGEIFNSDRKQNINIFSSFYNSVDQRENPTIEKSFFALSLNMENHKKVIKKKYYKLQDLFSDISGFFQIIYIGILVINYVYCYNKMNEQIINESINNYMEHSEPNFISNVSPNLSLNGSSIVLKNNIKITPQKKSNFANHFNYKIKEDQTNHTVVFKGRDKSKRKNNYSFSPMNIQIENKCKLIVKDTTSINSVSNQKILFEKLENRFQKKKFSLSFFQASNPYLLFCPYNYFYSKNKVMKNFAYFEEIVLHQLDVNNILRKLNFIDKFEMAFFTNKKSRGVFNNCYNPKTRIYVDNSFDDMDSILNYEIERVEHQEYLLLKEIICNEIIEKVNNFSNSILL